MLLLLFFKKASENYHGKPIIHYHGASFALCYGTSRSSFLQRHSVHWRMPALFCSLHGSFFGPFVLSCRHRSLYASLLYRKFSGFWYSLETHQSLPLYVTCARISPNQIRVALTPSCFAKRLMQCASALCQLSKCIAPVSLS